jgi:hypothetical protein
METAFHAVPIEVFFGGLLNETNAVGRGGYNRTRGWDRNLRPENLRKFDRF